ncbi:hypothetical protein LCGC14_0561790 [marine sediment metagenome]|uniref:Uncharacterized protein n=1 Tax=marine sediment metagenome TaxID=412755 RepID=A0A0F9S5F3_9ZZZZ
MVKFKVIKYKHALKAIEMTKRSDAGEELTDESLRFMVGLVKEWDFLDADTDEPLPVGTESMGEMSIEQMNEMTELFNLKMAMKTTVPKASAECSPSSSTESSQE